MHNSIPAIFFTLIVIIGQFNTMQKLDSKQLRDIPLTEAHTFSKKVKRNKIYFILENVYDTYNIGGIFRLADALAVSKIYLCGEMETPPNHKIQKASVGTYKIVPWVYKQTALEAIEELRGINSVILSETKNPNNQYMDPSSDIHRTQDDKEKIKIIAIEQSKNSIPYKTADFSLPVAFVVGNETFGLSEQTLSSVDQIVEIPMWGVNKSLNVIVSAAIVGYHAVVS